MKIDIYRLILQNQSHIQERQDQQHEFDSYHNSLPQRRTYNNMSLQQRSHASEDRFQSNGRTTTPQHSSMTNNIEHYGYSTVDQASPSTTRIPSPAPTNVSNESFDLFIE